MIVCGSYQQAGAARSPSPTRIVTGAQHRSVANTSALIRRWTTNRGFQKLFYTRSQAFRDFAVSIVGRNYRRPTPSDKAAKHLVSKPAVPAEFRFDRFAPLLSDIRMIAATRLPRPVCSFPASSVHVSAAIKERAAREATLFKPVGSHHPSMM